MAVLLKLSRVVESAVTVQTRATAHPVADPEAPVAREVLYDGRPVLPEVRDGQARSPEPREGQRASFVLRKAGRTPDRYGAVLFVNGENTLFRERSDPLSCRMWVLDPRHPTVTIRGYQTGEGAAEAFRVLSPAESTRGAIGYGADVGTIPLAGFRESQSRRAVAPGPGRVIGGPGGHHAHRLPSEPACPPTPSSSRSHGSASPTSGPERRRRNSLRRTMPRG